jgi:aminobenzoyl-glutamate utilization protein B
LREHVNKDVSISYIITDGGSAPNIIPDKASVWYILRARKKECAEEIHKRLVKVAKGAAMMTETTLKEEFLGSTYDALSNKVLEKVVFEAFQYVPQEEFTPEEFAFAQALNNIDPEHSKAVREKYSFPEDEIIHKGLLPMQLNLGSTDVGDIQHMIPGVSFRTACYSVGVKAHTWVATACTGHSMSRKGMIRASKIMALFGLRILSEPNIYIDAKREFDQAMAGKKYICGAPRNCPY